MDTNDRDVTSGAGRNPDRSRHDRSHERTGSRDRSIDDISSRFGASSKAKLEELLGFAQAYRKWTRRELATFLDRDVHNLIPASGIPKVDFVCRLARALDWPAHAVLNEICAEPAPTDHAGEGASYDELNRLAFQAFVDGQFETMIAISRRMHAVARSPEQRCEASLREWGGWDGLGRYEQCIDAVGTGLREVDAPVELRLRLRANLGFTYFALGRLIEGEGVASALLERVGSAASMDLSQLGIRAQALYVRGQCRRARALAETDERTFLATAACADLDRAEQCWHRYAEEYGVRNYQAMAHTCRGALVASRAIAGQERLGDAIEAILAELDRATDLAQVPRGTWLESYGWWCVFGAEIVLAIGEDLAEPDRLVGIFTNKGHEIAEHSKNWALRERLVTIDYVRRSRARGMHAHPSELTLDPDDVHAIAGVMARFPAFRPLGWELLRSAPTVR